MFLQRLQEAFTIRDAGLNLKTANDIRVVVDMVVAAVRCGEGNVDSSHGLDVCQ